MEKYIKHIFILLAFLIFSGAVLPLLFNNPDSVSVSEGNRTQQLIYLIIYFLAFVLSLRSINQLISLSKGQIFYWLLLIWTLLSVIWSSVPDLTARKFIAIFFTTFFGLYLGSAFQLKQIIKLLGISFLITIFLSYLFIFAIPSLGLMGSDGLGVDPSWRGVFIHKNTLGRISVLSIITFLFLISEEKNILWKLGLVLSIGLLIGSKAVTALVVLFVLLGMYPLLKILKMRTKLFVPSIVLVILSVSIVFVWVYNNYADLLGIFGKDDTLTGRTVLWSSSVHMALRRPLLGYGYYSFWLGKHGPSSYIWNSMNFEATHAHNGFLDLWLNIGAIGVFFYSATYFLALLRSISIYRMVRDSRVQAWSIVFLIFLLLYNLTESTILVPNHLLWSLFVMTIFSNGKALKAQYVYKSHANKMQLV